MRRWIIKLAASAVLAVPQLSLAAPNFYIKDDARKAATESVSTALADAPYLAAFDDQLKNLSTLDQKENRALATYWTAARDEQFTIITGEADTAKKLDLIQQSAALRWRILVGGDLSAAMQSDLITRSNFEAAERIYRANIGEREKNLVVLRERYARAHPKDALSVDCGKLDSASTDPDYAKIRAECATLDGHKAELEAALADFIRPVASVDESPLLQRLYQAARTKPPANPEATPEIQALKAEIKAAEDLAKEGQVADVVKLRARFRALLDGADPVVRQLGWEKLGAEIDRLAAAEVCAQPMAKVDKTLWASAKCDDKPAVDSTQGKDAAVWLFVGAIAGYNDATSSGYRSAAWLMAAKAITEAEASDAKLMAAAAKFERTAASLQLAIAMREASDLAAVQLAILIPKSRCGEKGFGCAYANYLESWNRGRIPLGVLAFTPVQSERRLSVQRARNVANRRAELIQAAVRQQLEFGAQGLDPKLYGGLAYDAFILFKVGGI